MPLTAEKWDRRFMSLAHLVASWSKDPRTQVGAVIVVDRVVLGMGFNGFPRGVEDRPDRYSDRPTKYQYVVHAEANALINTSGSVRDATLYTTLAPCVECTKLLIQAGIQRVVIEREHDEGWSAAAQNMLREAGVAVEICETIDV